MIGTRYPEIFSALTQEFGPREVRTRMLGNRQLSYVTARTVMNRLDSVIGPENWWDEYTQLQNGILCKLTVRLPDGEEICKSDAGGHAGMSDEGDDEKSGFSDAFKRAAVKFGIGRHLYGEGIPRFSFAPVASGSARPDTSVKANGNGKAKALAGSNGSARPAKGRSAKSAEAAPVEQPAPSATATLAFEDGPRSSKEFYEYVKSLDPEGTNGTRDFLVKWGKEQGYPGLVKTWSDDQARAGYERLKAHLEASADE
jgi:hypothetical protein